MRKKITETVNTSPQKFFVCEIVFWYNCNQGCELGVGAAVVACFRAKSESFFDVLESELDSLLLWRLRLRFMPTIGQDSGIGSQSCWNPSKF